MEPEWFEVPGETAEQSTPRVDGGTAGVAVGTTTTRTLESAAAEARPLRAGRGETGLFIYPGFRLPGRRTAC